MLKKLFLNKKKQEDSHIHLDVATLLPIGSVVLLKEGQKKLMVIGIMQIEANKPQETYDYLGVLYPEGYIGSKDMYFFNHKDIDQVFFKGYEDDERNQFIHWLQKEYS